MEKIGLQSVFETAEFQRGLAQYLEGLRRATGATEDTERTTTQSGQAFNVLGGVMMGVASGGTMLLVNAVGTLLTSAFQTVTSAAQNAITEIANFGGQCLYTAGNVDELTRVALLLGQRTGASASEVQGFIDGVIDAGIRADVAANLIANLSRRQLDLSQSTQLAAMAQDVAVLAAIDSSDALDRLNDIVITGNRMMARTIGLQVDFIGAQDQMAASLGVSREQLTATQITQANLNAVLAEGTAIAGTYTVAMDSPTKALRSLQRELFNVRAQLGAPFLGAWSNLIGIVRTAVQTISGMISEGGALYPVLVNLGAAAQLATEGIAAFVNEGIRMIGDFAEGWVGTLSQTADASLRWGVEIVAALADGIIGAASTILVTAMNYISSLLSFWLAPGSPPRVAPDLPQWGAEAMTAYLMGFTQADFGVLQGLQSLLRRALDPNQFAAISQDIARALTEGADEDFFATLAANAGEFGEEIAQLARMQFELANATDAVKQANQEYSDSQNRVSALVAEYNDMLRSGASEDALAAQLALINAAEDERDAARDRARETEQNIQQMEEEASLQAQMVQQLLDLADAAQLAAQAGGGGGGGAGGGGGGGIGAGGAGISPLDLSGIGGGLDIDPSGISTRMEDAMRQARKMIISYLADVFSPITERWNESIGPALDTLLSTIEGFGDDVQNALRVLSSEGGTILSGAFTIWEKFWADHGKSVETIVNGMYTIVSKIFNAMNSGVMAIISVGVALWEGIYSKYKENIDRITQEIQNTVELIFEGMFRNIGTALDTFAAAFRGDWRAFGEGIRQLTDDAWNDIVNTIDGLVNEIAILIETMIDDMINAFLETDWEGLGRSVIEGILNGLHAIGSQVTQAMQAIAQAAGDAWDGFWNSRSPSRRMIESAHDIMRGAEIGLDRSLPSLIEQIDSIAQSVAGGMDVAISPTTQQVRQPVSAGAMNTYYNNNAQAQFYMNNYGQSVTQAEFNQMADSWFRSRMGRG